MTDSKAELRKWLTSVLTEGVEVNVLFPNSYNYQHPGYGYQIYLANNRQKYYISLRRSVSEPRFFIHSIWKVRLDKCQDEKVHIEELVGQELSFEPRDAKTFWPDVSLIAITGILRLR